MYSRADAQRITDLDEQARVPRGSHCPRFGLARERTPFARPTGRVVMTRKRLAGASVRSPAITPIATSPSADGIRTSHRRRCGAAPMAHRRALVRLAADVVAQTSHGDDWFARVPPSGHDALGVVAVELSGLRRRDLRAGACCAADATWVGGACSGRAATRPLLPASSAEPGVSYPRA